MPSNYKGDDACIPGGCP